MTHLATATDTLSNIVAQFSATTFVEAFDHRTKAIQDFEKMGLPTGKTEEYRFTPITKSLEKNFVWNQANSPSELQSIEPYLIDKVDAYVITFVNGIYKPELSKTEGSIAKVASLREVVTSERVQKHFDKLVNSSADPFAALNTAFWQDGIFIHVPEGVKPEKPFLVLHINDANQSQVIAHTRILALLENNSYLSLIEKFDTVGQAPAFHTLTEEIALGTNAHLEYYKIQNDKGNVHQITNTLIHQEQSSQVNTFTLNLDGTLVRNNFAISIDGKNCESHFYGLYLLHGRNHADNHTVVDHRKPNSFSNEMYKGIMDDNSKGVFNGKIFVRPDAQKTNAFQSNRNILLTDTATINTKPQLEIWADDVKCSHGCTTGQLDEEALFYLQSRGIAKETAKAILLYAFAKEILEPVKNDLLKSYLDNLIAERLHKDF